MIIVHECSWKTIPKIFGRNPEKFIKVIVFWKEYVFLKSLSGHNAIWKSCRSNSPKLDTFCSKSKKNFSNIMASNNMSFLGSSLRTRKWGFWQPCRKNSAKMQNLLLKLQKQSENYWSFKKVSAKTSFGNAKRKFVQPAKVQKVLTKAWQKWKLKMFQKTKLSFKKILWTLRMQFGKLVENALPISDIFSSKSWKSFKTIIVSEKH